MTGESRHPMLKPAGIVSVRPASISGELLDMGDHPGLRLSSYSHHRVAGELLEFEALDKILDELDIEEGPEFRREIVNVTVEGGSHFAWIYVLAGDTADLKVIASGDWRKR
jgi:gamma-glutamylcyclotransferase (GGCT)/AIG2-like uncharacterized protein YtfP